MSRLFALALVLPSLASASTRVAVFPLQAGAGVTDTLAATFTESALAELRRVPDLEVLSDKELAVVLSLDQRKLLLGCDSESCATKLSTAVDAELLFTGSVAKVGESWLLHLKLLTLKPAVRVQQADRRRKGGSMDDLLDEIAPAVRELFPQLQGVTSAGLDVSRRKSSAQAAVAFPGAVEKAIDEATATPLRKKMKLLTDGSGGYLAFNPEADSFDSFYWGTKDALHAQRVGGGGKNGTESSDAIFWEPRVKARWQGSFDMKNGVYDVQCGDKAVPLTFVPDAEAAKILAKVRLLGVRWSRHVYAMGRDEVGTYYVVDQAREPDGNTDFHLFVGEKGHLNPVAVTDTDVDAGGTLITTAQGRFHVNFAEKKADWIEGRTKTPLVYLDAEDNAFLAYTKLGVYQKERLGTPCDGRVP